MSGAATAMHQVATVVEAALQSPALTDEMRVFLREVLTKPGRVLSGAAPAIWPKSVLAVAAALGGDTASAVVAAAAVEFAVTAIDVADELIDNEWQGDARSRARATNASAALAFMAQQCAADTAPLLGAERAALLSRLLAAGSLACCAGQDLDILLERTEATDEQAHEMTVQKSGSLVAMAFRVGASVATDEPAILEAAGTLGKHIGTVAQLMNDLMDVGSNAALRKGDVREGKRTLPIAFAIRSALENGLDDMRSQLAGEAAYDEDALLERMHDLGAQQYTWTVAEAHRQEALKAVRGLADVSARPSVARLRTLIPRVAA